MRGPGPYRHLADAEGTASAAAPLLLGLGLGLLVGLGHEGLDVAPGKSLDELLALDGVLAVLDGLEHVLLEVAEVPLHRLGVEGGDAALNLVEEGVLEDVDEDAVDLVEAARVSHEGGDDLVGDDLETGGREG